MLSDYARQGVLNQGSDACRPLGSRALRGSRPRQYHPARRLVIVLCLECATSVFESQVAIAWNLPLVSSYTLDAENNQPHPGSNPAYVSTSSIRVKEVFIEKIRQEFGRRAC